MARGMLLNTLSVMLIAFASDAQARPPDAPPELDLSYDYRLDLPPKFVRQNAQGIDSKVEEFRSADTFVSTDFGYFSAPPTCYRRSSSCLLERKQIAGRPSVEASYFFRPSEHPFEGKTFLVIVHVPVVQRFGLALNLLAYCDTRRACDEVVRYFRNVRILHLKQPAVR